MRKLLLCLVAAGFGCGGGGGDPSLQQYINDVASLECQKIFECCDANEIMDQFQGLTPPITTEAGCVQAYQGLFQALALPQLQASIDNGRLVYHADAAGACLDGAASLSCVEFSGTGAGTDAPPGCTNPFEGLVANDGACASDNECQSEYCEGDTSSQEGTCKTLPGDGAACPDFECADGFWCDFATNGGTCVATKADGTDCNGDDECQSGACVDPNPSDTTPGTCGSNMVCDGM